MAYDERELLARLIQCEAGGEGEVGMKAVAGVVMNRVNAIGGEYARLGQGDLGSKNVDELIETILTEIKERRNG